MCFQLLNREIVEELVIIPLALGESVSISCVHKRPFCVNDCPGEELSYLFLSGCLFYKSCGESEIMY